MGSTETPIVGRGHGSAYDRGDSDAYYMRRGRPHMFTTGNFQTRKRIEEPDMTPEQIAEYWKGNNDHDPCDVKDYGDNL